ncbi:MAG: hypothetical protein KAS36_08155 [Anaerolineales bacterium]|nr:hypothetical protein [Anaerolineales bacterium]
MYNNDTELIFPSRLIPILRDLRGELWQSLVDCALEDSFTALDHLAFVLLMVKLAHCDTCQADSYRALHGCTNCAQRTVQRFQGSDEDLMALYAEAREEMRQYIGSDRSL